MANAHKKNHYKSAHDDRHDDFPPEAYEYNDDVTPQAVEAMRKRAHAKIAAEEWVVVDGIGSSINAA